MNLVTLQDGTQVRSDSEAWRSECEIRAVLDMPSKAARQAFLLQVEKFRGAAGRKKLEQKILDYWNSYVRTPSVSNA